MKDLIQTLLKDPHWFPYESEDDVVTFRYFDRESSTMDYTTKVVVPKEYAIDHDWPLRKINVIYHTSFCGSTLLKKMLDIPGINLTFNEPLAFSRDTDEQIRKLYSRPMQGDEKCLVKTVPGDLLRYKVHLATGEKAIMLYQPIDQFVNAVFADEYRCNTIASMQKTFTNYDTTSVALMAAEAWEGMLSFYNRVADDTPNIRSLNCERMYADPHGIARQVYDWFEIEVSDQQLHDHVDKCLQKHSKEGRTFSMKDREQQLLDYAELAAKYVEPHQHTIDQIKEMEILHPL